MHRAAWRHDTLPGQEAHRVFIKQEAHFVGRGDTGVLSFQQEGLMDTHRRSGFALPAAQRQKLLVLSHVRLDLLTRLRLRQQDEHRAAIRSALETHAARRSQA